MLGRTHDLSQTSHVDQLGASQTTQPGSQSEGYRQSIRQSNNTDHPRPSTRVSLETLVVNLQTKDHSHIPDDIRIDQLPLLLNDILTTRPTRSITLVGNRMRRPQDGIEIDRFVVARMSAVRRGAILTTVGTNEGRGFVRHG
jgi:hypothetical protein